MAIDKDAIKKSAAKTTTGVSETITRGQTAGKQTPAGPEEQAKRAAEGTTRGRKGCKSPRINFATTPENMKFVSVMAKLSGRSVAKYMNFLIDEYRKDHPGLYEKALELMKEAGIPEDEI